MDILLANDSMPEYLFHNRGNGTFEEVGLRCPELGLDSNGNTFAGMGVDFEDYNNDGVARHHHHRSSESAICALYKVKGRHF